MRARSGAADAASVSVLALRREQSGFSRAALFHARAAAVLAAPAGRRGAAPAQRGGRLLGLREGRAGRIRAGDRAARRRRTGAGQGEREFPRRRAARRGDQEAAGRRAGRAVRAAGLSHDAAARGQSRGCGGSGLQVGAEEARRRTAALELHRFPRRQCADARCRQLHGLRPLPRGDRAQDGSGDRGEHQARRQGEDRVLRGGAVSAVR